MHFVVHFALLSCLGNWKGNLHKIVSTFEITAKMLHAKAFSEAIVPAVFNIFVFFLMSSSLFNNVFSLFVNHWWEFSIFHVVSLKL